LKLHQTIHLLGDVLGQVISEFESPAIFELEEQIRAQAKARRGGDRTAAQRLQERVSALQTDEARGVAAAFAAYFDLVNLAEDNHRVQILHQRQVSEYPEPIDDSIGEAVSILKARGVTREQMSAFLENLSIELVITAHPTEARRRTVLDKIERLAALLSRLSEHSLSPQERDRVLASLHGEISMLWLTERTRSVPLTVPDEVRTGLYFVESFFWKTIPLVYDDLERALELHYPGLRAPSAWLRLASWIGGDRDGNPNVTADVTAETLHLHRGLMVESHRRSLQELGRRLSVSSRRIPPLPALARWIERRRPLPPHAAYIEKRYAIEPYRLVLSLLAADLAEASRADMKSNLLQREPGQAHLNLQDLLEPVEIIAASLPDQLEQYELDTALHQLHVFGLHAARLDLREDSGRLNAALGEILHALDIESGFEGLSEGQRTQLLTRLLCERPPKLTEDPGVSATASETWGLFKLIARVCDVYGSEMLGAIVISNTHSAADVLTVLLLAQWAGCQYIPPISPLFESIQDLKGAALILDSLFKSEIYREHLRSQNNEQMVMIGYSDSNKDGGYMMANWSLYRAQEEITRLAQAFNVTLTIFHGRGGTTARGGGPANRAIRAQPPGSIHGRFRLTEQGEIIAARYANPALAHRHLEQIASAVLLASFPDATQTKVSPEWLEAFDHMAVAAQRVYRELVYENPGFIDFWQSATPLDEIKRLQIGSRPASRATSSAVGQIRAIPWVFSWMQSRFNLPGWYSLGTGLESFSDWSLLREMYAGWPFFKSLLENTEMSLLKADMDIAALYVELVPDQALGKKIFSQVRNEYERTRTAVLSISGHASLLELEPVTQTAVILRNPYIDPLNYIQVETLRRLRRLSDPDNPEAKALREVMALTINGIAAGLKNTG
jgi:phosphoenolpyruvate carboxylase